MEWINLISSGLLIAMAYLFGKPLLNFIEDLKDDD
jgi:hypothetical protein